MIQAAFDLHRQGRLADAERMYRLILAQNPKQLDAAHLLGLLKLQQGQLADAYPLIARVVQSRPRDFDALYNLSTVLLGLGRYPEALAACDRILSVKRNEPEVLCNRAVALWQLQRHAEALAGLDRVLQIKPDHTHALFHRGNVLAALSRLEEALASYDKCLALEPQFADALNNRGNVLSKLRRFDQALASYNRALAIMPGHLDALSNRSGVFKQLMRYDEALASTDKALAIDPNHFNALNNRATSLLALDRAADAVAVFDRALAINPNDAEVLANRAMALRALGRLDDALIDCDRALAVNVGDAEAWNSRGVVLHDLGRLSEALECYERALALQPDHIGSLINRGTSLLRVKRLAEAASNLSRAIALDPGNAEAHSGLGHVQFDLGRFEEALSSYDMALAVRPDHFEGRFDRGLALARSGRHREAIAEYELLRTVMPDFPNLLGALAECQAEICNWQATARLTDEVRASVAAGAALEPFVFQAYDGTAEQHFACAENWLRHKLIVGVPRYFDPVEFPTDKIRIAYLSADFRRHVIAQVIAELFEVHDRSRFEIVGVSFGPDDRSDVRARLIRSFDRFVDVTGRSDEDVAALLRDLKVHVAVDLMGHTKDARMGIFADRAAPIQVTYLGFPGTTGGDFMDYVLADGIVLPFDQQAYYSERIVHLPVSYQVTDRKLEIAGNVPARSAVGLPDDAFVFACFSTNWKITERMFAVWMRVLTAVEGSVLWLYRGNETACANLRQEAQARGVDPGRLVFAPLTGLADHLARTQLADLYLDTLPYNAHGMGSASLWAGVPVITCTGESFAARVGASLLTAVGLPQLVTHTLDDYEALALQLARDPAQFKEIRARLAQNRATCALFDTDRFRRNVEAAYTTMWETWARSEGPRSFSVEDTAGSSR